MGLFKHYRHLYKEPERFTRSEARLNRLNALLERERRFNDLPNFKVVKSRLSQASKVIPVKYAVKRVNDRQAGGHKAALIAAALAKFKESDFNDPAARQRYIKLRYAQESLRAAALDRKSTVSGSDKRRYDPTGRSYAVNTSGNLARMSLSGWTRVFKMPSVVIPCIQRHDRREVMFAKGLAGKGYRVRHRRTWASGIPC